MNISAAAEGFYLIIGMIWYLLCSTLFGADLRLPQHDWLGEYGSISIAEMNSKCDLLVVGKVDLPSDLLNNYRVNEVNVLTVLASRQIVHKTPIIGAASGAIPANLFLFQKWPFEYRSNTGAILLKGGTYLLWLTKTTNVVSMATNTTSKFLQPHTADAYSLTQGTRSVYLLTDPSVLQKKLGMRLMPYPWQSELLLDYIGINDISLFKSIVIQIAGALKSDGNSVNQLATLAKNPSNPQLAKVALEHLTKGVTNCFIYVNPRPVQ